MMERVCENSRTHLWACAAASTVAADGMLMLMTLEMKPRIRKNAENERASNESHLKKSSNSMITMTLKCPYFTIRVNDLTWHLNLATPNNHPQQTLTNTHVQRREVIKLPFPVGK
jgi:hypothetical protein